MLRDVQCALAVHTHDLLQVRKFRKTRFAPRSPKIHQQQLAGSSVRA
jgi:hypothetical protein